MLSSFLAATVLASPWNLQVPASGPWTVEQARANALTEQQLLVDDVWREVNRQFVDRTFGGLGEEKWRQLRLQAVTKVRDYGPDEQDQVYQTIRTMLEPLKDPYTRFLTPDQYSSLTAYATGAGGGSAGIGVQLLGDPTTGKIMVLNTIPNGPAATAGIQPGDYILSVNGESMEGATAEVVAAKCRGEAGSSVNLAIAHAAAKSNPLDISVTRAALPNTSVQVSKIKSAGKSLGLIKIASFNQETVNQVRKAVQELGSVAALVLDLRGNAGGYMPAGVDTAKLFLPPQSRVISEVDKNERSVMYINDGVGSETATPLYVLVDQRTASASEILTAALQDNGRAVVVGQGKTFGKGRIQNVQALEDGSGIAITKAKYITPNGKDINGVGIDPNKRVAACGPFDSAETCLAEVL